MKEIDGYNGNYLICKDGKVLSLMFNKKKCLKTTQMKRGYVLVRLYKNGKPKTKSIHRLLAEAFIPNPENKFCVNHKNNIKDDNRLNNLEWCTSSENTKHAITVDAITFPKHGRHSKLTQIQVAEIRKLLKQGEYTQIKIGKIYGVCNSTISSIHRRKNWA